MNPFFQRLLKPIFKTEPKPTQQPNKGIHMPASSSQDLNVREVLIKYFKMPVEEKGLTKQEFNAIKEFVDYNGGFKKEVFQQFKFDKELVELARDHQLAKGQQLAQASGVKEALIKFFKSKPGEKTLTNEEYKKVAPFIDTYKGGLNTVGYEIFKEDKEIASAARENRSAKREYFRENERADQPSLEDVKKNTIDQVRTKRPQAVGKSLENEIGD